MLTADRGFYSFTAWDTAAATGAALAWRAPTPLALPVVKVLTDGTYLTVVMDAAIRGPRREAILAAARAGQDLAEVEAALDEHPDVRSCAVIGLPDDDLGQRVHAVVELAAGVEVPDDDLRTFLVERLVSYKIPRSFERSAGPVRDDAGKVRRSGLVLDRADPRN